MYQAIFYTHIIVSFLALFLGITSLIISILGLVRKYDYKPQYRFVGKAYVLALYMQLAVGLLMYFYPGQDKALIENNAIDPGNSPTIRFWEIEHVAIMIFALFIVQIGCIFISNTKSSKRKYSLSLFYFGIPLGLMIFSMLMSMR